jgi:hypothetical protein
MNLKRARLADLSFSIINKLRIVARYPAGLRCDYLRPARKNYHAAV